MVDALRSMRMRAGLAAMLLLGCACRNDPPPAEALARAQDRPRPTQAPAQAPERAFDQAAVLAALEAEARERSRVRVLVKFEVQGRFQVGALSVADKKAQADRLAQQQAALLSALGRRADDQDVRRVAGLPFLAFEAAEDELRALRQRLGADGTLSLSVSGRATRLRVERAEPLSARSAPAWRGEPIARVLTRLAADPGSATGKERIVAVIDTAFQADALPLVGRIEPLSASIGVSASSSTLAAQGPTHGTKVACVVATAAPGCRILLFGLVDTNGSVAPDAVVDALQRIYLADAAFLAKIPAVCVSLASESQRVAGECAFDPTQPEAGSAFQMAVWNLTASGVSVVVAAGNTTGSYCTQVFEPWCMPEVLCVGSSDSVALERSQFSPWSDLVDVCAPGSGIEVQIRSSRGPDSLSGTSIAAPFVAALLARLAEAHPDRSRAEREVGLLKSGHPITDCSIRAPEPRLSAAIELLTPTIVPVPAPGAY